MSKAGEQIISAAQSGISAIHFFNPITGKSEPFTAREVALDSMLASAGEKIRELEREIAEIRSYLVMD
jgi:hypothetical protein